MRLTIYNSIGEVVEEIKELIRYYKFTTKQRVQNSNHLESLKAKDGSKYAIKDLQNNIKSLKEKFPPLNPLKYIEN